MNQEFIIGPMKIVQDELEGFHVARQLAETEDFEIIATFKYPVDAIRYFTEIVMAITINEE